MPYLPHILLPELIQKPLLLLYFLSIPLILIVLLSCSSLLFILFTTFFSLAYLIRYEHRYVWEEAFVGYNCFEELGLRINPRLRSFEVSIAPVVSQVQLKVKLTRMSMFPSNPLLDQMIHVISVP